MQYNISPETLVETKHPSATVERLLNQEIEITGDYAVCANGAQYRKDIHGFLPEMMQKIYDERKQYKKLMLAAKQEYEKSRPWMFKSKSHASTISKCTVRYNSTLPMVPSETNTSDTTIWQMLRRLPSAGKSAGFAGLKTK